MIADSGQILFAVQDGHYVLKFLGDMRLTLCSNLDEHLRAILQRDDNSETLIDLTETHNIDSTSLGWIAKLAVKSAKCDLPKPTMSFPSVNPSADRTVALRCRIKESRFLSGKLEVFQAVIPILTFTGILPNPRRNVKKNRISSAVSAGSITTSHDAFSDSQRQTLA